MSIALYPVGGLRFWSQKEIMLREQAIARLLEAVSHPLLKLNSAWTFQRMEGPILTPRPWISPAYTADDIWEVSAKVGADDAALRAETTASSYLYAQHLLGSGESKFPLCVWQAGKSFRRETNDGARASELRFNEFWQCEFQCIYKNSTKADYRSPVIASVMKEISAFTNTSTMQIASERLPSYSKETIDIEALRNSGYKEMASISLRTDFPMPDVTVLEVAVGLDRLVCVAEED